MTGNGQRECLFLCNWTAPQAEKSSPTPETEQPCRKRPLRASGRACLGGGRGGHPTPDSWCLGLKWQLWPEGTDAGGGGGGKGLCLPGITARGLCPPGCMSSLPRHCPPGLSTRIRARGPVPTEAEGQPECDGAVVGSKAVCRGGEYRLATRSPAEVQGSTLC